MRLDIYLTENGICKSRTAAQSLIKSGGVILGGKVCEKPSAEVGGERVEVVGEQLRYVGRGGLKLEKALEIFGVKLDGALCIDIGASTGGFTDCMLQNGAARVFAVDVGRGQLDEKLRGDPKVVSLEQTDIRAFDPEKYGISGADFIGTDVSFISLKMILPHINRLLAAGGTACVLIKPQFEVGQSLCAGRSALNKKGIVRDEKIRLKVVEEIKGCARENGLTVLGTAESPIKGGDGNTEYLMGLRKEA